MSCCCVCNERAGTQEHHLSYFPEIKIKVCVKCHELIHRHCVGKGRRKPILAIERQISNYKGRIITRGEIDSFCSMENENPMEMVRYFLSRKIILRIFRGCFYVNDSRNAIPNFFEILPLGLNIKVGNNWYFGLNTALKLNNMTHEFFAINEVINDKVFRPHPIGIMGHSVKFYTVRIPFTFGIKEEGPLKFSDKERTIMDLIYFKRYGSVPDARIELDIEEFVDGLDLTSLKEYSKFYPKTVSNIIMKVMTHKEHPSKL